MAGPHVSRFAVIGAGATILYAIVAFVLSGGLGSEHLPAATASVTAYAVAAVFSYAGHKYVTFMSDGAHSFEVPRFAALTGLGLAVTWTLPKLLVDAMGLEPTVPIVATCIIIPVVNYVVLDRWVFAAGRERTR